MMITAGVDIGNKFTKVVIVKDGKIVSKAMELTGFDPAGAADKAYAAALSEGNKARGDVAKVVATGAGAGEAKFADDVVTVVGADAKGAFAAFPAARTVIDVGAEEGRAIRINDSGKIVDFAINEKCAAGAGSFIESMARALEVPLEEMGPLALKADKSIAMNAQCVVFAESEVVSLVHAKTRKENISKAVHDAISARVVSMVRRIGVEKEVLMIGGVAKNVGFVKGLSDGLDAKVNILDEPEFVSAFGAALAAAEE